jgi:hypothetical protein
MPVDLRSVEPLARDVVESIRTTWKRPQSRRTAYLIQAWVWGSMLWKAFTNPAGPIAGFTNLGADILRAIPVMLGLLALVFAAAHVRRAWQARPSRLNT